MLCVLRTQAGGIACLGFLWLGVTHAQIPAPAKTQAPRMFRAVRSPAVYADGSVTFRFYAPGAKKVLLVRDGVAPVKMCLGPHGFAGTSSPNVPSRNALDAPQGLLDASGVWSLTTTPLAPDFYTYFFIVDGVPMADPSNTLATEVAVGGHESILHVPGPDSLSWEARDIPHGTLHRHEYTSATLAESRSYWVYTPPGFDPASQKKYPVLYLLHGVMDTDTAWIAAGRANVILDNLIERGQAKPMIVVFPLGYGFSKVPDRVGDLLLNAVNQRQVMDVFAAALLDEICPQVERIYPLEKDRESRAIAGVSMGGAQALHIGLNHLDRFAWIGSFSGAFPMFAEGYGAFFPHLETEASPRLRLFWISIGTEDFLLGSNREFNAWLESKGVRFTGVETPGAHEWPVWHRNLAAFAPLLFKPTPK